MLMTERRNENDLASSNKSEKVLYYTGFFPSPFYLGLYGSQISLIGLVHKE